MNSSPSYCPCSNLAVHSSPRSNATSSMKSSRTEQSPISSSLRSSYLFLLAPYYSGKIILLRLFPPLDTSSLGHGFYTVRNCIFFNFGFSSGLSWEHNVSYLNLTWLEYVHCWDIEMELKVFTPTSVCSRAFLPNTLSTFIYFTALWRYT